MFQLTRALPCEALSDLIDTYYLVDVDCPPGDVLQQTLLPELPNVRFQLEGDWDINFLSKGFRPAPRAGLFGFTHAPFQVRVEGKSRVFGFGLKPLGWQCFVRRDASELADTMVDISRRYGGDAATFSQLLRSLDTVDAMADLMDKTLMAQRAPVDPQRHAALTRFLNVLEQPGSDQICRVDELANRLGLSVRQVERSSRDFFGCSPKLLLRKNRFLSMLSRNPDGAASQSWLDAADESFYDQSHYIREYKRFTGKSPQQFAKADNVLQNTVVKTLADLPERKPSQFALKIDVAKQSKSVS